MIFKRRFIVFYILRSIDYDDSKQVMQQRMSNPSHLVRFNKIRMMLANVMVILVIANMMNFTSCNLTRHEYVHYHRSINVIELLKEVTIILFVKRSFNCGRKLALQLVFLVIKRLSSKQTMVIRDTSFDDLKGEIEHLKEEIKF
ncbi:hypothetical protein H5410_023161 [Solanum commersonii]|uniref:Uncharacterized protein n=1 Tax=Solanum commersonii TaxID=4109 RepID=A0A9J5ZIW5_SOLCO|nr:hypothetical protein H5410_023161 [Solanum commersonii]